MRDTGSQEVYCLTSTNHDHALARLRFDPIAPRFRGGESACVLRCATLHPNQELLCGNCRKLAWVLKKSP